jgi:hypothetical protein
VFLDSFFSLWQDRIANGRAKAGGKPGKIELED